MDFLCNGIESHTVYPILIKNKEKHYLTLFYYTKSSDSILHSDKKQIIYFRSTKDMEIFCKRNNLQIENEVVEYDFDESIENPIDYKKILEKWNLLNTIAGTFGMFFEGDCKKYTSLYDLLFRLCTLIDSHPTTYQFCEKNYKNILKVFRKKDRFLDCFELYRIK